MKTNAERNASPEVRFVEKEYHIDVILKMPGTNKNVKVGEIYTECIPELRKLRYIFSDTKCGYPFFRNDSLEALQKKVQNIAGELAKIHFSQQKDQREKQVKDIRAKQNEKEKDKSINR